MPKRQSTSGSSYDANEGRFSGHVGSVLAERYLIERESGVGTFGRVLLCKDLKRNVRVAVKVIRKVPKYIDAAKIESEILEDVNNNDPNDLYQCVRYYKWFRHDGHACMVFEPLGESLYQYIKRNRYKPLPLGCVQEFADQLVRAVAYLHSMKLIHTDLKPENVLLTTDEYRLELTEPYTRRTARMLMPKSLKVKLIDFGGATYDDEHKASLINTRQYRAPEVILGLGWSYPGDMWSVGCILMELYLGELLFATHDNPEHLALMEVILGPLPRHMSLASTKHAKKLYDSRGRLYYWDEADKESLDHVRNARPLKRLIHKRDNVFYDLVSRMLEYDPNKRITAAEALNHRFFVNVRGRVPEPRPYGSRRTRRKYSKSPSRSRSYMRSSGASREGVSRAGRSNGGSGGGGGGSGSRRSSRSRSRDEKRSRSGSKSSSAGREANGKQSDRKSMDRDHGHTKRSRSRQRKGR